MFEDLAWLGGALLLVLTLLYVFHEPLQILRAWVLNVVFALGLLLAAVALVFPSVYPPLGQKMLASSGLLGEMRRVDSWVHELRTLPERTMEKVRHPLAEAPEEVIEEAVEVPQPPQLGPIEEALAPKFRAGLAGLFRGLSFLFGVLLMVLGLVFRSGSVMALQNRSLRNRIQEIEERVDGLDALAVGEAPTGETH